MFEMRLSRVRKKLEAEKADAFFILNHEYSGQPGTRYLSGFSGSNSLLLITKTKQLLATDGRYFTQAEEESPLFEVIKNNRETLPEVFSRLAKKLKMKKIIFDGFEISHGHLATLKEHAREIKFKHLSKFLDEMRITKDQSEIRLMRKSASIAESAFKDLLRIIRPNMPEKLIAAHLEFLMRRHGAEKPAFETIVVSGKRGALPHGKPSDKKIQKGELMTIDFGAYYEGYASDMTRTIAVGKISKKLRDIYKAVQESQELGCKNARAGMTGQELDALCRRVIQKSGYGKYFLHSTGHGIGLEVHELPWIRKNSTEKMPENSIITCEPGIYIEGLGGVRIEDMLLLKKSGAENLTSEITKDLLTL